MGWPVSRCGSSDYRKRVPAMGSTRVQEDAEDQGVRRQKERQARRERDATQGNRRKRVCRGLDSMGRRGNEATTQGISWKMVCRGWDERMK